VTQVSEEEEKKKIPIKDLLKYKLFIFGMLCSFFNLIFFVLLEPILSQRLTKTLNVDKNHIGVYFCIQPFVYAGTSVLATKLVPSGQILA
jgi:hypothetical protein